MSDVNIIVTPTTPANVNIGIPGVQGPTGPTGATGAPGGTLTSLALTGDVTASGTISGASLSMAATIANGAVTPAKMATSLDLSSKTLTLPSACVAASNLGATENLRLAKAWLNFNGTLNPATTYNLESGAVITPVNGTANATWYSPSASWSSVSVGLVFHLTAIGNTGSNNGTLGGVAPASVYIKVVSITDSSHAACQLVSGTFSSGQTVTGNGSNSGTNYATYTTSGIRSSYNVSSITKNAVGSYTINFTNAMNDSGYCILFGTLSDDTNGAYGLTAGVAATNSVIKQKNTSGVWIYTKNQSNTVVDVTEVSVAIFGD